MVDFYTNSTHNHIIMMALLSHTMQTKQYGRKEKYNPIICKISLLYGTYKLNIIKVNIFVMDNELIMSRVFFTLHINNT